MMQEQEPEQIKQTHLNGDSAAEVLNFEIGSGVKRYDTDWAKSAARGLLRDATLTTVGRFVKMENLKVFCLAGVDCAEIFDVYDRLGVQHQNITIAERNPQWAAIIKQRLPAATVLEGTAREIIESIERPDFHVVSIDYTGPVNSDHEFLLRHIGEHTTQKCFLIHQVNLLARDKRSQPLYKNLGKDIFRRNTNGLDTESLVNTLFQTADAQFESRKQEGESTLDLKATAISSMVTLSIQDNSVDYARMARLLIGDGGKIACALMRKVVEATGTKIAPLDPTRDFVSEALQMAPKFEVMSAIQNYLRIVCIELCARSFKTESQASAIFNAATEFCTNRKLPHLIERQGYSYISESASPMYGEIQFFKHSSKYHEASKKVVAALRGRGLASLSDFNSNIDDAISEFEQVRQRSLRVKDPASPLFAGNSALPLINRELALVEFKKGLTNDEISRNYRGCKDARLRAWRAHVTMGTYGEAETSEVESKLTETEVLALLNAGIPSKEILKAWPDSFSAEELLQIEKRLPDPQLIQSNAQMN